MLSKPPRRLDSGIRAPLYGAFLTGLRESLRVISRGFVGVEMISVPARRYG